MRCNLSPFLNTGISFSIFMVSEKMPVKKLRHSARVGTDPPSKPQPRIFFCPPSPPPALKNLTCPFQADPNMVKPYQSLIYKIRAASDSDQKGHQKFQHPYLISFLSICIKIKLWKCFMKLGSIWLPDAGKV